MLTAQTIRVGTVPSSITLDNSNGLGMVLTYPGNTIPWEVIQTLPGGPPFLDNTDPQHFTKGEYGYYYDTSLGTIPTDFQLATRRNYQPVESGWIHTDQAYLPPPYVPPNEWRPVSYPYYPPLAGAESVEIQVDRDRLEERLWQKTYFWSALGATAAFIGMMFNAYRALHECHRGDDV